MNFRKNPPSSTYSIQFLSTTSCMLNVKPELSGTCTALTERRDMQHYVQNCNFFFLLIINPCSQNSDTTAPNETCGISQVKGLKYLKPLKMLMNHLMFIFNPLCAQNRKWATICLQLNNSALCNWSCRSISLLSLVFCKVALSHTLEASHFMVAVFVLSVAGTISPKCSLIFEMCNLTQYTCSASNI